MTSRTARRASVPSASTLTRTFDETVSDVSWRPARAAPAANRGDRPSGIRSTDEGAQLDPVGELARRLHHSSVHGADVDAHPRRWNEVEP